MSSSRTQQGNNNAYCQDNEISWYHWDLDERCKSFLEFARRVIQYRKRHPNFHRYAFYDNDPDAKHPDKNIVWFRADGKRMGAKDWENGGWMRTLGMFLNGTASEIRDSTGIARRTRISCCCSTRITSRCHFASPMSCTTPGGRLRSTPRVPNCPWNRNR